MVVSCSMVACRNQGKSENGKRSSSSPRSTQKPFIETCVTSAARMFVPGIDDLLKVTSDDALNLGPFLAGQASVVRQRITPHIRFLFIARPLWNGLPTARTVRVAPAAKSRVVCSWKPCFHPPHAASWRRPCPSPCLRAGETWPSDFHRRSSAP